MPLLLTILLAVQSAKLPLVEVPAVRGTSDTLIVFVSGDGGWAALDKTVARVLSENGLPVVGLNALQYFWTKRTPEQSSRDLQTIIDTYRTKWNRSRVVLVGYSRGADVLPAMVTRLAPAEQKKVRLIALLGPSPKVQFEFHMTDWLHDRGDGVLVKPEVDKLVGQHVVCIAGEDDHDSLCPSLHAPAVHVVMLKGAHHFDGGYEKLARIILDELK